MAVSVLPRNNVLSCYPRVTKGGHRRRRAPRCSHETSVGIGTQYPIQAKSQALRAQARRAALAAAHCARAKQQS